MNRTLAEQYAMDHPEPLVFACRGFSGHFQVNVLGDLEIIGEDGLMAGSADIEAIIQMRDWLYQVFIADKDQAEVQPLIHRG